MGKQAVDMLRLYIVSCELLVPGVVPMDLLLAVAKLSSNAYWPLHGAAWAFHTYLPHAMVAEALDAAAGKCPMTLIGPRNANRVQFYNATVEEQRDQLERMRFFQEDSA